MKKYARVNREFLRAHPEKTASKLLGKYLIRRLGKRKIVAKIVETEAYGGKDDKGCHVSRFGYTRRTAPLFGEVGYSYIYSVHINMYCLNIVSHQDNQAGGILIRAAQPIQGINWILENLGISKKTYDITKLLNGPAKLCRGLKIDKTLNGIDMIAGDILYLTEGEKINNTEIIATPRINIPYAEESKEWLWRFVIKDSKFLSR